VRAKLLCWTSLPATKIRMPFLRVRLAFSATLRHAVLLTGHYSNVQPLQSKLVQRV